MGQKPEINVTKPSCEFALIAEYTGMKKSQVYAIMNKQCPASDAVKKRIEEAQQRLTAKM